MSVIVASKDEQKDGRTDSWSYVRRRPCLQKQPSSCNKASLQRPEWTCDALLEKFGASRQLDGPSNGAFDIRMRLMRSDENRRYKLLTIESAVAEKVRTGPADTLY